MSIRKEQKVYCSEFTSALMFRIPTRVSLRIITSGKFLTFTQLFYMYFCFLFN